jgi:hypothetical protein
MNGLEFVASLLGMVFSWPVLVFVIVWLFRAPLRELIGRIKSYEGLGQKVTFGDQLAKTEDSVEAAVGSIGAGPEATDRLPTDEPAAVLPNPLALDAQANPSFAVITAWEQVSGALADLVGAAFSEEELKASGARRTPSWWVPELRRRGVMSETFERAIRELRDLRNHVAHGQHNPTPGEAVAYVETASELSRAMRVLADLELRRRSRNGTTTAEEP